MSNKQNLEINYFDLTKHNSLQLVVFSMLFIIGVFLSFSIFIPIMEWVFSEYLQGEIYRSGQVLPYSLEPGSKEKGTDFFFSWCVDVYKGTAQETRYWFNPVFSPSIFLCSAFIRICIYDFFCPST